MLRQCPQSLWRWRAPGLSLTREISQGLIPSFPLFDVLIDILISSLFRKNNVIKTFKCVYVFSLF